MNTPQLDRLREHCCQLRPYRTGVDQGQLALPHALTHDFCYRVAGCCLM